MPVPHEVAIAGFRCLPKALNEVRTKIAAVSLALLFLGPDLFATDRIMRPKVGEVYVYSARLSAVDVKSKTFTVRGSADNKETLTLTVHPRTRLFRDRQRTVLENGRIGELISGTLTLTPAGRAIAMSTTFGAPLPARAPTSTRIAEVNGLAGASRVRDPLRGNVTSGVIAMPIPMAISTR